MPFAPFALAFGWCLLHFMIYLVSRGSRWLGNERAIFMFHAVPFGLFVASVLVAWFDGLPLTVAAGIIALHAIYSTSFLELWSLSDGSYSLSILKAIHGREIVTAEQAITALSRIGDEKKAGRLQSLQWIGMVKAEGDRFVMTGRGEASARGLRAIRWLVNYSASS